MLKHKLINKYYLIIIIIILLETQFFYLLEDSFFNIKLLDICVAIEGAAFLLTLLTNKMKLVKNKYSLIVLFGVLLCISSAFAGYIYYDQPILMGINVQRIRITSLLFYFSLICWIKNDKINKEGLIKLVFVMTIIYLSICIIQYFLKDITLFTHSFEKESLRYGRIRFRYLEEYFILLIGIAFDNLFKRREKKIGNLLIIVEVLFLFFVINMSRMASLSLVVAIVISVIIRKGSSMVKFWGICGIIIGLIILINTQLGEDITNIVFNSQSTTNDTLTVRNIGKRYYLEKIFDNYVSILIGCGTASANCHKALLTAYPQIYSREYGYKINLYPQDNGIVAVLLNYGCIGLIWWIYSLVLILITAKKISIKNEEYIYLFMLIYEIVSCISLVPILFGNYIITPIILALINSYDIQETEKFKEC